MARIIRLTILVIFICLPLLALSACGSDSTEAIKYIVNSFYSAWNSKDFEQCLELFSSSLGYSEVHLEIMGEARENTGELVITDLGEPAVSGTTATILAEITPSESEPEYVEIPLVKEGGSWKLEGGGLSSGPAEEGDIVRVHYTLTLEDGTEHESSHGGNPIEFTLGAGRMIAGFENAVYGMQKGETKTVTIPPEEAYGLHDEDLLIEIDRANIPAGVVLEVGGYVTVTFSSGMKKSLPIVEITETSVILDDNHQLAGESLTFEITFVGVVSRLAPGGALR